MMRTLALLLGLLIPLTAQAADPLERFSSYDLDGDGTREIESLRLVLDSGSSGPLVLVLVEDRLLTPMPGLDLRAALRTHAEDLTAEGFRARYVAARLYQGPRHQDGRTLLALRRFLQAVRKDEPGLQGVILVGAFPDALLVRTCNWIKRTRLTLRKRTPQAKSWAQPVWYLRTWPETIAHRADIVLADLDGSWEERYVEPRTLLPWSIGVFPQGVPLTGGTTKDFERGGRHVEDFFLVHDGQVELKETPKAGLTLTPRWDRTDGECTVADRRRKNPLAQPEIFVSRLNARGVAFSPHPSLLDDKGQPRKLRYPSPKQVPDFRRVWVPNPALERRLLQEYFARNHRFRRGYGSARGFRPASVSHGLRSGFGVVKRAHPDWRAQPAAGLDVRGASLVDLVLWLQRPAAFRTVRAHSNRGGSVFKRTAIKDLERAVGTPWSWTRRGAELVPSLAAACRGGGATFFLYRTLYANGIRPAPSLYLHTGCQAISPQNAERLPWSHPGYGLFQGGESILFYAGGLALVGRAKVFYDEPRGFAQALAADQTFGAAWAKYYEVESRGPTFAHVGGRIGRKRAYFWSVLGDWTLRLRRPRVWY